MRSAEDRLFRRWCRRSDAGALAELFDSVAPQLLRLGLHLVGNAAEAEDLVQATFLALIEQRTRLDGKRPAWPWLASVLAHKAKNVRRRAARPLEPGQLVERIVEDPSAPAERRELSGELAKAIDRLEEPYRQPILLSLRHGLTAPDVAHVLGRDPGTVRVQLHRAFEKLRPILPVSLAPALALYVVSTRGLAAVRACVLGEAAATGVAATSVSLAGAWIVNQKITLVSGALVAALVAVLWSAASGAFLGADQAQATAGIGDPLATAAAVPESLEVPTASGPVGRIAAPATPSSEMQVRGRVVDGASGRPIAGAHVRLFAPREVSILEAARESPELYEIRGVGRVRSHIRADWPYLAEPSAPARFGREPVLAYDRVRPDSESLAEAISDDDGRFTLASDGRGGLLVCEHPGYSRRVRAAHDPEREWLVALWEEREVTGVVVTFTGDSPGVPLTIALAGTQTTPSYPGTELDPESPRESAPVNHDAPEGVGAWRTECGGDGSFTLSVTAEELTASILTLGWRVRNPEIYSVERQLRIIVQEVPVLHFFDAATEAPIERVRLLGREQTNGYVRWSGMFDAPDGLLEIGMVGPSTWDAMNFTAWAEGYREVHLPSSGFSEGGVHDVPLERGQVAVLEGTVRSGGRAAVGAVAALLGHSPLQWSEDENHLVDAVRVNAAGFFRFEAAPGRYVLRIDHGETRYFELVELPRLDALDLDLDDTGRISVEVADDTGIARVHHVVALRGADGRSIRGQTDIAGMIVYANLSPQDYTVMTPFVSTEHSFSADVFEKFTLARGEQRHVRLELPTLDGVRHFRVHSRGGVPYGGWRARFGLDPWEPLGPDGTVPQDLPTIHHQAQIESPAGRRWSLLIPRDAQDGETIELDLGHGSYEGILEDANGRPLPGWRVNAVPLESPGENRVTASIPSDEQGRFELTGLHPGAYYLDLRQPGRAYDFSNGRLMFAPDSPAEDSSSLTLTVPIELEETTLRGVVLSAVDRAPLENHIVAVSCEAPSEGGAFLVRSREHPDLVHTDGEGRFELRVPRTQRFRIRVYAEWSNDGPVLDQSFNAEEPLPLELLVE